MIKMNSSYDVNRLVKRPGLLGPNKLFQLLNTFIFKKNKYFLYSFKV